MCWIDLTKSNYIPILHCRNTMIVAICHFILYFSLIKHQFPYYKIMNDVFFTAK